MYIICHQYHTNTKVSRNFIDKNHSIESPGFGIRPRFVTLGQVENTGLYKNIVYFPSVNDR